MRIAYLPLVFAACSSCCAALLALGLTAAPVQAQVPRYAKVSNNGDALPDSATLGTSADDWACTYDRETKLIWEVKTDDDGLRDKDHTYANDTAATFTVTGGSNCTLGPLNCTTRKYVDEVNATNLCGANDWRMPTGNNDSSNSSDKELQSLVVPGPPPTIDTAWFPNTPSSVVWSGSPHADLSGNAWVVGFSVGYASYDVRYNNLGVRLVRAGQSFVPLPVLTDVSVSAITTSATLTATSDVGATGYWVVVPRGSGAPSAAQVEAGTDSSGAPALASGNETMSAGILQSFSITGLNEGTDYDLYLVAKSDVGLGDVVMQQFSTLAVIDGACGAAANVATLLFPPAADLCSAGTPENSASVDGGHAWQCAGSNGGVTAQCEAPGDSTQGGGATLEPIGGTGCTLDSAALIAPPGGGPNGVSMPYGVIEFAASGCTGGSITLQATFAGSVEGMGYWKYINGNWKSMPATLEGNTVTFTIEDNGPYDADPTTGSIADPGGPGFGGAGGAVAAIPTLSQWAALALAGLLGFISLAVMRRRG